MELQPDQIRLDCAALHLARDAYPLLNIKHYLSRLDALAHEVALHRPGPTAAERQAALRAVLVEKREIAGNVDSFYDPQNSYLNRVLDTGRGVPTSLAIVWVEVGRRLRWPVAGVNFPGRFLVRVDDPLRFVIVDPFDGGRILGTDDCREMLDCQFEGEVQYSSSFLDPADSRTILTVLLNGLKSVYFENADWGLLATVLRRLAAVEPDNGRHLKDLAAVHCRRGDVRSAYAHLAAYLEHSPNADDHAAVRYNLARLQAAMMAWN